jgi:hypothetical protein
MNMKKNFKITPLKIILKKRDFLKGQVKWQTIKDIHPLKYIKVIEWV